MKKKPQVDPSKKQKKIANWIVILIVVITLIILGVIGFLLYKSVSDDPINKDDTIASTSSAPNDGEDNFIDETVYIGGIGYPEVYQYPFQKSEYYKSNKDLWKNHPEIVPKVVDAAQNYMNYVLSMDYKDILDNKSVYVQHVLSLKDNYMYYDGETEEDGQTPEEYVESMAEFMIDNHITMEGKFITDTSLVYEDAYLFVRGIMEYEVYSSNIPELPADGEKKTAIVELALARADDDFNKYEVIYVYNFIP